MKPPTLFWSAELAAEAGGEPLHGLVEGNSYGLFCWDLRGWARLASLPNDVVELGPITAEQVVVPAPAWFSYLDASVPVWTPSYHEVAAYNEGVEIDGSLDEDVDGLEEYALALLAAVRAHRRMVNGGAG